MASPTTLEILIQLRDEATQKMNEISGNFKNFEKNIEPASNAGKAFGVALLGIGAAGVAGIGVAVKAAADAQEAMSKVDAIIKTMGGNFDETKNKILEASSATVKLGFDDEDAAISITQLFQRTGDLTQAIKLNAIAMDLSRAKNIDLSSASKMVSLVLSGNAKLLKQYGIEIDETKTPLEALNELQKKVSGSAQEFGNTFNGQMEVLKVQISNLMETLGDKFLPTLIEFVKNANDFVVNVLPVWIEKTEQVVNWLKEHQAIIYTVAGAIVGGLTPAFISLGVALITTVIPAFLASAIALAPWLIGGAIIGGIVAGIVWLVQNWTMVGQKANEIWGGITKTLSTAYNNIKNTTIGVFTSVSTFLKNIWDGIANNIKSTINGIITAINGMVSGINSIKISVPKVEYWPGKFFGGFDVGFPQIPQIPYLAQGGIVTSPTIAMIGEAGPEAVIPLSRFNGQGSTNITVNISGNNISNKIDLKNIADEVSNVIMNKLRLNYRI
ncbi:MAG: hypothetical protein WC472_01635 [Candidatus Paceibacterota bacterium]